jgi:hypothetical protein
VFDLGVDFMGSDERQRAVGNRDYRSTRAFDNILIENRLDHHPLKVKLFRKGP